MQKSFRFVNPPATIVKRSGIVELGRPMADSKVELLIELEASAGRRAAVLGDQSPCAEKAYKCSCSNNSNPVYSGALERRRSTFPFDSQAVSLSELSFREHPGIVLFRPSIAQPELTYPLRL